MNKPLSILLVDDDKSGRTILGISLKQAGMDVRTAASGEEALKLLDERAFDWLVTDGKMLPMDGFELAKRAKAKSPALHVAMISAVYTVADAAGSQIERFFVKPVAVESLVHYLGGA
jgi:DNA-binding NtrC family response regulator